MFCITIYIHLYLYLTKKKKKIAERVSQKYKMWLMEQDLRTINDEDKFSIWAKYGK